MRILGMVISLAAIVWVMYQAAGGGEAETVITQSQQQSLDAAKSVEQNMQKALEQRMSGMDTEASDD